ncbi:DUF7507 domain-containing protein [Proteiniclasticum ruminis]|uniref:Conserved repeat domain-containing protein n=1 Tax=Proteiniclasticum ruminis TaxID=398199 RepID=A0A1I5A6D1_9CLOT|nr:SdrD B-like domain-containing protein [Proteiniclasticum ruminis]SFN57958.1 conserved repeat domain-containing protein [Proteiniclasticum ruminis]
MNKKYRRITAYLLMILVLLQFFVKETKVVQAENESALSILSVMATTESGEAVTKVFKEEPFFLMYEVLEKEGVNFVEEGQPQPLGRIPAPFLIEEDQEVPVVIEGEDNTSLGTVYVKKDGTLSLSMNRSGGGEKEKPSFGVFSVKVSLSSEMKPGSYVVPVPLSGEVFGQVNLEVFEGKPVPEDPSLELVLEEGVVKEAVEEEKMEESLEGILAAPTEEESSTEEPLSEEMPTAGADNPLSDVRLELSTHIKDKVVYFTGEEVFFYLDVDLSAITEGIDSPELVLRIPKKYVQSLKASDLSAQDSKVISVVEEDFLITYKLTSLTGGMTLRVPFSVTTHNGNTPDGYVLPVEGVLKQGPDQVVKTASLSVSYAVYKPNLQKSIRAGSYYTSTDGVSVFAGVSDEADPSLISSKTGTYVSFIYQIVPKPGTTYPSSNTGGRNYSSYTITDYVPEGAVFDKEANLGWVYDEVTREAVFTGVGNSLLSYFGVLYNSPVLKLRFPSQPVNTDFVNKAKLSAVPLDKTEEESLLIREDDIKFRLNTTVRKFTVSKNRMHPLQIIDDLREKSKVYGFNLTVNNTEMELPLENFTIRDYGLDERMKFTRVEIPRSLAYEGLLEVVVKDAQGVETLLDRDISVKDAAYVRDVPEETEEIILRSQAGGVLPFNSSFTMRTYVTFKDPASVKYSDKAVENYLYNYMEVKGAYKGVGGELSALSSSFYELIPYKPQVYLSKTRTSSSISYFMGEEVQFTLTGWMSGSGKILPGDEFQGEKIVDLLPPGIEYVPGSGSVYYHYHLPRRDYIDTVPEVVYNYKGTGLTALIWSFLRPVEGIPYEGFGNLALFNLYYRVKVTKYAAEGTNTNSAWLTWTNNDKIFPLNAKKDQYDIDGDGNVEELFSSTQNAFRFIPPKELILTKKVKGSLDDLYLLPPSTGGNELGTEGVYELQVYNNSIVDISTLGFLDVLPHVGDEMGVPDREGNPIPRGSQFPVSLTGPVTVPSKFTAYYSSTSPLKDLEAYYAGDHWSLEVSDYSAVKAVKIVLTQGVLKTGQKVSFYVPYEVPLDTDLKTGMVATNSFMGTVNTKNFFETNAVSTALYRYEVDGYLFNEEDGDGVFQEEEGVFSDYIVELTDEKGNPVLDPDGNPVTTRTDEKGYYHLDVFREGTYKIRVKTPEGYEITTLKEEENLGSHLEPDGSTKAFPLNRENLKARKNAGFLGVLSDMAFTKSLKEGQLVLGNTLLYSFSLKNTGTVSLRGVKITDALEGISDLKNYKADEEPVDSLEGLVLSPGSTLTAEASYEVTQKDVDRGFVLNHAEAAAYDKEGKELKKEAKVRVEGELLPEITLTKTSEESSFKEKEEVLHFTLVAENTGNVTLYGVEIEDLLPDLFDVSFTLRNKEGETLGSSPVNGEVMLLPGEALIMKASYRVTQKDADQGEILNRAVATAYRHDPGALEPEEENDKVADEAELTIKGTGTSSLSFEKTVDRKELLAGDLLTYTFTLKNTGERTLKDLRIVDGLQGLSELFDIQVDEHPIENLKGLSLLPGEVLKAKASYLVTQKDVDAGILVNEAVATALDPQGEKLEAKSTAVLTAEGVPYLTIRKTSDKTKFDHLGEEIRFTVEAKNQGAVTIKKVLLADHLPNLYDVTVSQLTEGGEVLTEDVKNGEVTLLPGQSLRLTASYKVTEEDLEAKELINYAEVTGEDPKGEKLFASDKVTLKKEQGEIGEQEEVSTLPSTGSAKEYWPLLGLILLLGGGGYFGSLLLKSERRKRERRGARPW